MININVFSSTNVDIERQEYNIWNQEQMIKFIKDLLDKAYYGGEQLCLEKATIVEDEVIFEEIERWK